MRKLAFSIVVCCLTGCGYNCQRFVPMPRAGDEGPFVLDTKTGQFCDGSPRQNSVFPLCHDLYTGKIN
jgi:hypothetical protein